MLQTADLSAAVDVDMVAQLHSDMKKRKLNFVFDVARDHQETKKRLAAIEVVFGI